jgi:glycerol kinase
MILAIDQGTTNTKAILMDAAGKVAARASRPVPIEYPQPGWVEQDGRQLWRSVQEAVAECLAAAGQPRLAAIGVTNQRETALIWDRVTGEPAGPCIVWQCRRTAPFCSRLREEGREPMLRERTGLAIDPLFSASKIRWLLDAIPDGQRRAESGELCAGTIDSWVLWNLTEGRVHACDATNASRTQLLNLARVDWDEDLLSLFGVPRVLLPEIRPSSHVYGETGSIGGLPAGLPVGSLIGDSHAALFGHAAFATGLAKATYGTGSSLMTLTSSPARSAHGLSATIAWWAGAKAQFALEGNITVTGGAIQWVGELLQLGRPSEDAAELASEATSSEGVYLVPAFAGLGAPHWDPEARGLLCGLTRGATAKHIARAAVESIAYQVRDVFEAMALDTAHPLPELLADGGASRNDDLMQFQADILDRPVRRNLSADLSAAGAAWLAGLAVGLWRSQDELAALPRQTELFLPQMAESERASRYQGWLDAVNRACSRAGTSFS